MGTGHGGSDPRTATVSVRAVEALIASLPGVTGVRVLLDPSGSLGEVHVLADASRPPKAIVRDIESGLAARWGMAVDHRRISVAQMLESPLRPRGGRLRLQQWAVTIDPLRGWTEVAVSLTPGQPRPSAGASAIWQGRAAGSSQVGLRVAAEAVLEALNQSVQPDHRFALIDLCRVTLAGHDAVVCLLHYRSTRGGQTLTGSALVRHEAVEAAVRAVLNGSNRLVGLVERDQAMDEPARTSGAIRPQRAAAEAAAALEPPDASSAE